MSIIEYRVFDKDFFEFALQLWLNRYSFELFGLSDVHNYYSKFDSEKCVAVYCAVGADQGIENSALDKLLNVTPFDVSITDISYKCRAPIYKTLQNKMYYIVFGKNAVFQVLDEVIGENPKTVFSDKKWMKKDYTMYMTFDENQCKGICVLSDEWKTFSDKEQDELLYNDSPKLDYSRFKL